MAWLNQRAGNISTDFLFMIMTLVTLTITKIGMAAPQIAPRLVPSNDDCVANPQWLVDSPNWENHCENALNQFLDLVERDPTRRHIFSPFGSNALPKKFVNETCTLTIMFFSDFPRDIAARPALYPYPRVHVGEAKYQELFFAAAHVLTACITSNRARALRGGWAAEAQHGEIGAFFWGTGLALDQAVQDRHVHIGTEHSNNTNSI